MLDGRRTVQRVVVCHLQFDQVWKYHHYHRSLDQVSIALSSEHQGWRESNSVAFLPSQYCDPISTRISTTLTQLSTTVDHLHVIPIGSEFATVTGSNRPRRFGHWEYQRRCGFQGYRIDPAPPLESPSFLRRINEVRASPLVLAFKVIVKSFKRFKIAITFTNVFFYTVKCFPTSSETFPSPSRNNVDVESTFGDLGNYHDDLSSQSLPVLLCGNNQN